MQLGNTTFDADVDLCKICGTCIALCLGTHARLAFAVGPVECRLRKYRDECNRIMPQWERDIKDNTSTQLKLPGVRKLHIFKWLLPHCKNWKPFMSDHNFDLYFPKLADLEERTLKRQKIEPQTFVPTNVLPDSVIEVLCDVYKRVLFVMRVMPYMYEIECIQFRTDLVDHIMGTVRVVAPDEVLFLVKPAVVPDVDMFYLHLSDALQSLAVQQEFRVSEIEVRCDALKTTAGGKSLTLLSRMAHLSERWSTNMGAVMSLLQAQFAFECACPYAEAYDEKEGVITPREGFDDELGTAIHVAIMDKPVLQHSMKMLHNEFLAMKCTFAKPVVSWVKRAWKLKMHKYRDLPGWVKKTF